MLSQKNRRITLLIAFVAFILLFVTAATSPLLMAFLCGMLTSSIISFLTFVYWLLKS